MDTFNWNDWPTVVLINWWSNTMYRTYDYHVRNFVVRVVSEDMKGVLVAVETVIGAMGRQELMLMHIGIVTPPLTILY